MLKPRTWDSLLSSHRHSPSYPSPGLVISISTSVDLNSHYHPLSGVAITFHLNWNYRLLIGIHFWSILIHSTHSWQSLIGISLPVQSLQWFPFTSGISDRILIKVQITLHDLSSRSPSFDSLFSSDSNNLSGPAKISSESGPLHGLLPQPDVKSEQPLRIITLNCGVRESFLRSEEWVPPCSLAQSTSLEPIKVTLMIYLFLVCLPTGL